MNIGTAVYRILLLYIMLLSVFISGCSTAPVSLSKTYIPSDETSNIIVSDTCLVKILAIEDHRQNKQNFGQLGQRPVFANDFAGWLASGFKSFENKGYWISVGQEPILLPKYRVDLLVKLKAAYIRPVATSKCTQLVLNVAFKDNNQTIEEKNYRGSYVGLNWSTSESEINDSFNSALSKILDAIENDLKHYCKAR